MKLRIKTLSLLFISLPFVLHTGIAKALAQSITPASDSTRTNIHYDGKRYNITGGSLSGDGSNLFHSFSKFGLNSGETANFLSQPSIRNILGRVTGGDASFINGIVQVSGGNSNLFLMNPAGIVFGSSANLNIPASFTATTATGIGLNGSFLNWFNAIGENNYKALVGTPNNFRFSNLQPGVIVNTGNLAVAEKQDLTLLGGTVVSTGQLQAPGGQITIASVPGENLVRLSQTGHLLSLEIEASPNSSASIINPLSLPQLLTGAGVSHATGLAVNNNGKVKLIGSNLSVEAGDVVAKNITAESAIASANRNLTLFESQLHTTGDLKLLAQDTVRVRDSVVNPFVVDAGGDLYIQGNKNIDILALNHPQIPFISGGNLSLVSNGIISGDAHYASGGSFSILNLSGKPGNFLSIKDPIIVSDGDVNFGDYTGASLWIEAAGSIIGGNITINGIDPNISEQPTLILRAGRTIDSATINLPASESLNGFNSPSSTASSPANISVGNITIGLSGGTVYLDAPGNIQTGAIASNGGDILLNSKGTINTSAGALNSTSANSNAGEISLFAAKDIITADITASSTNGNGGNITIYSQAGTIDTSVGRVNSSATNGNAGLINFYADNGNINTGNVNAASTNANGADVNFYAGYKLITKDIDTTGIIGGNITLTSIDKTGYIDTSAGVLNSTGGAIALQAVGNITTSNIYSSSGFIDLISETQNIDTSSGEIVSNGGNVALHAYSGIKTKDIISNGGDISLINYIGRISTGDLNSASEERNGGAIWAFTQGDIIAEAIDSHSKFDGGDVGILTRATTSIRNNTYNIFIDYINTQGGDEGYGGDVYIDAANNDFAPELTSLLISSSFVDQNGKPASISTFGKLGVGAIGISYKDDPTKQGFKVGEATFNGTFADITNGVDTLSATPPQPIKDDWFEQGLISITKYLRITSTLGAFPPPLPASPPFILPPSVKTFNALAALPVNNSGENSGGNTSQSTTNTENSTPQSSQTLPITQDKITQPAQGNTQTSSLNQTPGFTRGNTSPTSKHEVKFGSQSIDLLNQETKSKNVNNTELIRNKTPSTLVVQQIHQCLEIEAFREEKDLINIRELIVLTNNFSKTIQCYQENLLLSRQLKDRVGEGEALYNLGVAYFSVGEYAKAIASYQDYFLITQELKFYQGQARSLAALGATYSALGEYNKAIEYYQKSLEYNENNSASQGQISTFSNLGIAYLNQGNYERAIEYQQQSLAIARQFEDRRGEAIALGNLGNAYSSDGDYQAAINYQNQSLAIAQQIKDRIVEARALLYLGHAYYGLKDYQKAADYYGKNLAIAQALQDLPSQGQALNNLGDTLIRTGKLAEASEILFKAVKIWESLRAGLGNNDLNKVSIFETQATTYTNLQEALIAQNQTEAALEIAERGRARAFVELLDRRFAKEILPKNASITPTAPTIKQIKQIAKEQNSTLVEYSIIRSAFQVKGKRRIKEDKLYIWVIQPTGKVAFRQVNLQTLWLKNNSSLDELVSSSRSGIGIRGRGWGVGVKGLKELHQLLIEPIADLLPKDPNARVTFLPHESLFLVPFPALQDSSQKFLIEKHTILTAPAIQVLALTRKQRQSLQTQVKSLQTKNALVVGNPTMPRIKNELGELYKLPQLPGAEQEAQNVAQLLKTQAIIGNQATKTAILKQLPQAQIIHFATHGLLDDFQSKGVPGAIALAPSSSQLNSVEDESNALLSASEILDLKLNAELVVLSACNTGQGRITGDGVIGLSRSFISAGVPSVLVSLWAVPDAPTTLLMTEFYKNLLSYPDKAQALRQAMLTTMQENPNPIDWAAFTLIGEAL